MMLLKQCYLLLWQLHFCFSVFEQACFGDVICTKMLFATYFNIVYYNVIKAGLYLL